MQLRIDGRRLFFGGIEFLESGGQPAHDQAIKAWGVSPRHQHIITLDEVGDFKIWDSRQQQGSRCIKKGNLPFKTSAALGISDDASFLAIAQGNEVTIFNLRGTSFVASAGHVVLSPNDLVAALNCHPTTILCQTEGFGEATLEFNPDGTGWYLRK